MKFFKALEDVHEEREVQGFYLSYTRDRIIERLELEWI